MPKVPAYIITDGKDPGLLFVRHPLQPPPDIEFTQGTEITIDNVADDTERTKHRIHIYRLDQTANGLKGVYISHRVNMRSILHTTNCKPRYLFRAYSSSSGGFNSVGLFKSQAAKEGRYLNVESLTEDEMASMLRNHMLRKKFESHFISFSLSYLWVFHRALALKERKHQHVRIAVIDTWDIPSDTWVRHAHSMLQGYGVERELLMKNLGKGELLVWDKLRVPMSVVKLDDMLKAGVLTLLPFYKMPDLDIVTDSPTKKRKNVSQWKKPCVIRRQIFKHLTDARSFVQQLNENMATKYFQKTYVASRSFHKKNFSPWWLQQKHIPLSHEKMLSFVTFVETFFPPKYQFPMLVTMLSMRLDEIDTTDIIDSMEILKDHPMMSGQDQCFKGKYRRGLKELESFEWLLERCADALGIPCRTFQEWHKARFAIPRTRDLHTILPFLTWKARKNFETRLKQELDRKREVSEQDDRGLVERRDASVGWELAVSQGQMQFPKSGKRKAEDEQDSYAVKKGRCSDNGDVELEAFVQKLVDSM